MYLLIGLPVVLFALFLCTAPFRCLFALTPYVFFFIGPVLTYFDIIGVLTGFNGDGLSGVTFGITFYTIFIAYNLSVRGNSFLEKPWQSVCLALNPLYLFTGPFPVKSFNLPKSIKPARFLRVFSVVQSDLILGVFFSQILSPALIPYFYLKNSTNVVDVLLFGFIFEVFVYFNFAGYSMIAWALMRLAGIKAPRNFRQPLGASSLVDYWQRWHISLSTVLKELFYSKLRPVFGLHIAVIVVFISSALWHGVSSNFLLWGVFHSSLWIFSYYLNKWSIRIINYIVLILGVVVGRVIFSELDWSVLSVKLIALVDFREWKLESDFLFSSYGIRETINVLLVTLLVAWEVVSPRLGILDKDYKYLKAPIPTTLMVVYTCFMLTGSFYGPVYGNR